MRSDAVELVRLNGSIDRLEAGLLLTSDDYAYFINRRETWYEQVVRDHMEYTFVFIGTRLNAPIFWHHVNRITTSTQLIPGQSFIVVPDLSENGRLTLIQKNIVPFDGTLDDFLEALNVSIDASLAPINVFTSQSDAVAQLRAYRIDDELAELADEAKTLVVVNRAILERSYRPRHISIPDFYFGSQPTRRGISDGVPARLAITPALIDNIAVRNGTLLVHGPAGSGKTTS